MIFRILLSFFGKSCNAYRYASFFSCYMVSANIEFRKVTYIQSFGNKIQALFRATGSPCLTQILQNDGFTWINVSRIVKIVHIVVRCTYYHQFPKTLSFVQKSPTILLDVLQELIYSFKVIYFRGYLFKRKFLNGIFHSSRRILRFLYLHSKYFYESIFLKNC